MIFHMISTCLMERTPRSVKSSTNGYLVGKPDGNEGVGVEIPYLEHAYGTKHYVVNKITGNICAIHVTAWNPQISLTVLAHLISKN